MMSTYRKMKGKLTTTQKSPTKCQDFFCPYFLHNQEVSGLSDRPPTKVVLSPSAT